MPTDPALLATLPPDQQRIWAACYHPTGTFAPFSKDAVEQAIPERFEQQVRQYPDRLAVIMEHQTLTYAVLHQAANRVAHAILAQSRREPEPIALLIDYSTALIIAILGVLKAGKMIVPLDPFSPQTHHRIILEDTQARLIVTTNQHRALATTLASGGCQCLNIDDLSAVVSSADPCLAIAPESLAYITLTSGSTGKPKGVVHNHRNVLHNVMHYTNAFHICPQDRLVLLSSSSSRMLKNIFTALCNGATLCMYDIKQHGVATLATWLSQEAITVLFAVPTVFRHFVHALTGAEVFPALRLIHLGGEPVYKKDVESYRSHFSPPCILVNRLGSTETFAYRMYFIDHDTQITSHRVPVGYGLEDMEMVILDEHGAEVGENHSGEIAVKSRYLAPGYWRRPDLTTARFLEDAAGGKARLYLTGDIGSRRPDGCLLHLGRKDAQVKIRGQRVDVADVEEALRNLQGVAEAVVVARHRATDDQQLIGYIVPNEAPHPTVTVLRKALAAMLPDYMIPSAMVMLEKLPLLPNGKVDRRALPTPGRARPSLHVPYVAPRTPIEVQLAGLWAEVLDLEQVGMHDPFLELGGHSLLATKILARIIKTFRVDLPLRTLLETPTVAAMALVITQHQAMQADPTALSRLLAEVEALAEEDVQRCSAHARPAGT